MEIATSLFFTILKLCKEFQIRAKVDSFNDRYHEKANLEGFL